MQTTSMNEQQSIDQSNFVEIFIKIQHWFIFPTEFVNQSMLMLSSSCVHVCMLCWLPNKYQTTFIW